MLTVVCFDIADNRRRRALVRVLESFGLRVQESIFECWLPAGDVARMKACIARIVLTREDSVLYYQPVESDEDSDNPPVVPWAGIMPGLKAAWGFGRDKGVLCLLHGAHAAV